MTDDACTCEAPPARIATGCQLHGLPALHRRGLSTHGARPDLVIVDDPWQAAAGVDLELPPQQGRGYLAGGIVPAGAGPALTPVHPGEVYLTRDQAAALTAGATAALDALDAVGLRAGAFRHLGPASLAARRWVGDVPPRRWRDWQPSLERPVDRARRQHLDRQLRTLTRRARRDGAR